MVKNRALWPFSFVMVLVALVPSTGATPQDSAQAAAAFNEMLAAYKSVEALHIRVTWTAKYSGGMSADDFPLPGPDMLELRMQRPNRFFLSATSSRFGKPAMYQIVSDGVSLWFWRSWTNTYLQVQAPPTVSEIAQALPDEPIGVSDGATWEIQNIFEWDALATPVSPPRLDKMPGVEMTMSTETLGDARVTVIRMTQSAQGVQLTIQQRFVIDPGVHLVRGLGTTARGRNPENNRDFTVEMQGTYGVFTTQPKFTAADFTFVAPRGSKPATNR